MSFALQVKEEVVSHEFNNEQKMALLSGFVKHNAQFIYSSNGEKLKLEAHSNRIARVILTLCKEFFKGDIQVSIIEAKGIKKNKIFQLTLTGEVSEFLELLSIYKDGVKQIEVPVKLIAQVDLLRAYIAGIFIAVGSVNSPKTSNYHLELQFKDVDSATYFAAITDTFDFEFKIFKRNEDKFLCYIKKAILVSDFIKLIDAPKSVMEFENERIQRDVLNSFNRMNNIDISNDKKAIISGNRQVEQIEKIIKNKNFYRLSEKAQLLANIRLENQDASYSTLEAIINSKGVKITKSGISSLFKAIEKISEEL